MKLDLIAISKINNCSLSDGFLIFLNVISLLDLNSITVVYNLF